MQPPDYDRLLGLRAYCARPGERARCEHNHGLPTCRHALRSLWPAPVAADDKVLLIAVEEAAGRSTTLRRCKIFTPGPCARHYFGGITGSISHDACLPPAWIVFV